MLKRSFRYYDEKIFVDVFNFNSKFLKLFTHYKTYRPSSFFASINLYDKKKD